MKQSEGPWRITFDTNPDHCNLNCIMCEDHSPYSKTQTDRISKGLPRRIMDISIIEKTLANAEGSALTEIIPSTMGEPLVYKGFEKIIDLCHKYNLKLNLTTNGTFPIKGVEQWAEILIPVTSDVKISWNGATKETQEKIMLGSNWDKALSNLKTFIKLRDSYASHGGNYCSVTLQLTFLESNIEELDKIVQLGIDNSVDRIKGHHLWAHFKEIKDLSMRRNNNAVKRWNQAVQKAHDIADNNLLKNGKKIKLDNIFLLDEDAFTNIAPDGECPFLGKEAWIAADGKFSPCCAPDKERQKLGKFGNIHEITLNEIWKSKTYQDLQKNYISHDICKSCNMRKPK